MTYPKNWPALQAAALSYVPPESADAEYQQALSNPGSAPFCVGVFNALKGVEGLDNEGLGIALGAARLINTGSWYGQGVEALNFIEARSPDYVPAPSPDPEVAP